MRSSPNPHTESCSKLSSSSWSQLRNEQQMLPGTQRRNQIEGGGKMKNKFGSCFVQNIRRLWVIGCCVGFHWCGGAAEQPQTSMAPAAGAASLPTGEQDFADPFAAENGPEQPHVKISDPLEPINRVFFKFNDKLYSWVLKPGAQAYSKVAPKPIRTSIRRFFANARYPVRLVN